MKVWYDCEFWENGRTIDLISIGMVAEDGRKLYLISTELPWRSLTTHDFLRQHVAPHLPIKPYADGGPWDFQHPDINKVALPVEIAKTVSEFIERTPDPALYAYYAAYDHVALCQLFGPMVELPPHIPKYTNDLKQECDRLGNPELPGQFVGAHNALADAEWNKQAHEFLMTYERYGRTEVAP